MSLATHKLDRPASRKPVKMLMCIWHVLIARLCLRLYDNILGERYRERTIRLTFPYEMNSAGPRQKAVKQG